MKIKMSIVYYNTTAYSMQQCTYLLCTRKISAKCIDRSVRSPDSVSDFDHSLLLVQVAEVRQSIIGRRVGRNPRAAHVDAIAPERVNVQKKRPEQQRQDTTTILLFKNILSLFVPGDRQNKRSLVTQCAKKTTKKMPVNNPFETR